MCGSSGCSKSPPAFYTVICPFSSAILVSLSGFTMIPTYIFISYTFLYPKQIIKTILKN